MKPLLLVLAGIAIGAMVFSNLEFSFSGFGSSSGKELSFSGGPRYAEAKNTIEDYPVQSLKSFNEAFVQIAESATPSVVTVYTEKTVSRRMISPFDFFGHQFDDFFSFPGMDRSEGRKQIQHGIGSGVIVTDDGYILTNNHVIDGADTVFIRTSDNRRLDARVIGTDPKTDLAVIKVTAGNLKPIALGNSDQLRVGEWVIAIGSPLGENLARTVTQGIVSAKGRANVGLADYEDFIQTDAAINPGNSGGPLVNINGELVGINTAIASRTGGFEGIGFAVPSNMARRVMTALITNGKVTRGYLGVSIQDIDDNLAKAMQLERADGALVGTVVASSPAAAAGIATGDVITTFNGAPVKGSVELRNTIAGLAPGTEVSLTFLREGRKRTVRVRLGQQPAPEPVVTGAPGQSNRALGFTAAPLTPEQARRLGPGSGKVVITSVEQAGNAYRAGLRKGDVILAVNRKPVESFAAFGTAVRSIKEGELLFLLVDRQGNKIYFAFNL
ncbi:DegQ family serine endoprotease [Pelodictyon luteolum]|uniref:Peptidase S1C, Do n=1 Tax=Chlorobium luteolum (strain DSM 273 / BCRC 81028 / 2530) TaxID=319225 RepID=Q3B2V5_CHLL3|nr:DegQ family serine endoprotease [Pelodictyon luteolum]ABB24326.1 Peptidase S1C, Do [Pelodictyon luteolum DSM 273]